MSVLCPPGLCCACTVLVLLAGSFTLVSPVCPFVSLVFSCSLPFAVLVVHLVLSCSRRLAFPVPPFLVSRLLVPMRFSSLSPFRFRRFWLVGSLALL